MDAYTVIKQLEKEIQIAEASKARLEGQLEQLMEQLQTICGCVTVEEATEKLNSMRTEVRALQQEIDAHVAHITTQFSLNQ